MPIPAVLRAQRNHPDVRFGASHMLFHELVPTILGQRITAGEAIRQWHRLCRKLGEPAPGPPSRPLLPPSPASLAGQPAWWFHPLGVEAKRAEALRTVASMPRSCGVGGASAGRARGQVGAAARESAHGRSVRSWRPRWPTPTRSRWATSTSRTWSRSPRRRAAWHRRTHARAARAVCRPARQGRPAAAARRPQAARFGPRKRILPMARW